VIELFTPFGGPFEKLHRAVDGDAFFVAGDEKRDRALRLSAGRAEMVEDRRSRASDAALHVDGATAIKHAIDHFAGKRRMVPCRIIAGRDHIGVASKDEMRRTRTDPGIKILDRYRARLGERDAMHGKTGALEHAFEIGKCAAFRGRHRRAAQ
jgi:hypothetical protein